MAKPEEKCFLCKGSGLVGHSSFRGARPVMKACPVCRATEAEPVYRRLGKAFAEPHDDAG